MRVAVVMPAYNAEATLGRTYREVRDSGVADHIIVVDDGSRDGTAELARGLPGAQVVVHPENRGYGANQKTCYRTALEHGADAVVMVHPDYQYTPRLLPAIVALLQSGLYDCVLASRILGGQAVYQGMPIWKYIANRFLTVTQNLAQGEKLSEYHTGYRAFTSQVLQSISLDENSDDFVFDNQMLAQILWAGFSVCEVTCPTRYSSEASSINFARSLVYGVGCLKTSFEYRLATLGLPSTRFPRSERLRFQRTREEKESTSCGRNAT